METSDHRSTSPQSTVHALAPNLLLSLIMPPLLFSLVGGKLLAKAVQEVGVFSEELFRGDRLPTLDFPPSPTGNSPQPPTAHP